MQVSAEIFSNAYFVKLITNIKILQQFTHYNWEDLQELS